MLIETLDNDIKKALIDRLDSSELVDFLQIPIEVIIELLEDTILASLPDLLEYAGIESKTSDYDEDYD